MATLDTSTIKEIQGNSRTIRQLLAGSKYQIDYYQREYKWKREQIEELIDDLSLCFLTDHREDHPRDAVEQYKPYFLGSIVISKKGTKKYIVDGQQRLTTLTLLLIFLKTIQENRLDKVEVNNLIFSEKFAKRSFNIEAEDYPERQQALENLYLGKDPMVDSTLETVQNIYSRYEDIKTYLSEDITDGSLPYFVDWLLDKVVLVEITAYNDDDAYTIFETMNDRGLMLSPVDMLKGFLLANITSESSRNRAADLWRKIIVDISENNSEISGDFFKAWLRSQYAMTIREPKKNASAQDYDRLGTEFHRWIRENAGKIGLKKSDDFLGFIENNMRFYGSIYQKLRYFSKNYADPFKDIYHIAQYGFTLHIPLILASIDVKDTPETIERKIRLLSAFVDIWLTRRIWNYRAISSSSLQYRVFQLIKDVRRAEIGKIRTILSDWLQQSDDFETTPNFSLHSMNRYYIHRILARMTDTIESVAGKPTHYVEYVAEGKNRYEVEHIWANHYERHTEEFPHSSDFASARNRIGALLLVPKKFNASFGDLPYSDKVEKYYGQNYLAKSLSHQCYKNETDFLRFVTATGLPFRAMDVFNKNELEERQRLYIELAKLTWSLDRLNV
jgi:uncharacterized protein with ParB-like and HNH nuclease domain